MLTLTFRDTRSFRHGIHPEDYKEMTRDLPLERMPFMDELVLPLRQHLGAPSKLLVRAGAKIYRGQLIGEASGFVSANLHSSVTGTVKRIGLHHHASGQFEESIIVERDPYSPQSLYGEDSINWQSL